MVCPLIEESEKIDVSAAETVYDEMRQRFGEDCVDLLHGRLSSEEKDEVMERFTLGKTTVLVTTTVVEVGVDVQTATVMMIDGAQRFGLAQLHQLRGRVGRGTKPSECYIVADIESGDALKRLNIMGETNDGFLIAQEDLRLRGPGELYGKRQAGLPGFKFADISRDIDLLVKARDDVAQLVESNSEALEELNRELTRRIMSSDGPVGEESG